MIHAKIVNEIGLISNPCLKFSFSYKARKNLQKNKKRIPIRFKKQRQVLDFTFIRYFCTSTIQLFGCLCSSCSSELLLLLKIRFFGNYTFETYQKSPISRQFVCMFLCASLFLFGAQQYYTEIITNLTVYFFI